MVTVPNRRGIIIIFPGKQYKLILADPPWRYDNKNTGGSNNSGSCQKYPTLSLEDIKTLPVRDIAMRDSCLFLWATSPLLPEAFEVMKSWGYQYKTAIYWRKIMSLGMGFWFRGQIEVCLLGVRGNVKAFRSQKQNFIQAKVRKHSQKPDELYEIIESLDLNPKIELFARERRDGWDAVGLDVCGICINDSINKIISGEPIEYCSIAQQQKTLVTYENSN